MGGQLFVTIDHGGGVTSTYSWLTSTSVHKGDVLARGDVVAHSGAGHPVDLQPSLHMGVKRNGDYVDPMDYLGPIDIGAFIRLAPLSPSPAAVILAGRPPPRGYPGWFP